MPASLPSTTEPPVSPESGLNADGEKRLAPQQGTLRLRGEMRVMDAAPCDSIFPTDEARGPRLWRRASHLRDYVAPGATREQGLERVRLLIPVNDVRLRKFIAGGLTEGFDFLQFSAALAFFR